ncbi:MAG: DUF3540 domain-containing protein [Pseudomonadota bacterium]
MTAAAPREAAPAPEAREPRAVHGETRLQVARVLAVEPLTVVLDERDVPAARAFGCLVEPAVGDRVLVARTGGEVFILSILDRLVADAARIRVPGALTLAASDLTLEAGRRLVLSGAEDAVVRGERVSIQARTLSLVGRMLSVVMDQVRSVVRRHETMAEAVVVQAGERTTLVRGADVAQAGTLVQQVDTVSSSSAATTVIVAREDVRVDAKRVTVG